MEEVLGRMGEGPDAATALDRADDALNGWVEHCDGVCLAQALKRVEAHCLYYGVAAPSREDLEQLMQLHQVSQYLEDIGEATHREKALLQAGKRPALAVRDRREFAEGQLRNHLETYGYPMIVRALRHAERKVIYFSEVDLNDEVHGDLLLLRELTDRIEQLGAQLQQAARTGSHRNAGSGSRLAAAAQEN